MNPLIFSTSCVLVQFAEPLRWCRRQGLAGRGCEAPWEDSPFSTWQRDAKTSCSCTGVKEKTHTSRAMNALLYVCCMLKGMVISWAQNLQLAISKNNHNNKASYSLFDFYFFFYFYFLIWNKSQCYCYHSVLLELFSVAPVLLLSKLSTFGCRSVGVSLATSIMVSDRNVQNQK